MASGVSISELKILFGAEIKPLLDALQAGENGMRNFQKEAEKIVAQTRTPQEKYIQSLQRLDELRDKKPDIIDYDTYLREKERLYVMMRKETDATEEGRRALQAKAAEEAKHQQLLRSAERYVDRAKTAHERYREEIQRVKDAAQAANWSDAQRIKVLNMLQQEYMNTASAAKTAAATHAKGFSRSGMAIGELARGAEDFMTVFGTMGFAGGMRAAANNMSQAAYVMAGPLVGGIIGVGTALGTVLLPKLYDFVTGADDAAKASKNLAKEIDSLARSFTYVNDVADIELESKINLRNISKMTDEAKIDDQLEKLNDDIEKARNLRNRAENEMRAQAEGIIRQIITPQAELDFNEVFDFLGRELGSGVESFYKEDLKAIKDRFAGNLQLLPMDEALEQFERDIDKLTESMEVLIRQNNLGEKLGEELSSTFSDVLGFGGAALGDKMFQGLFTYLDDPAVLDNIQAILNDETQLEQLAQKANKSKEEFRKQLQDIAAIEEQLLALEEQRVKAVEMRREAEREAEQTKLNDMLTNYAEQAMINRMTEQERERYELEKKRIELREQALLLGGQAATEAEAAFDDYVASIEEAKRAAADLSFGMSAENLVSEMMTSTMTDAEKEQYNLAIKKQEFMQAAIAAGQMQIEQAQALWEQYEQALEAAKQLEEFARREAEYKQQQQAVEQSLANMQEKALLEGMNDVDKELYRIQNERIKFLEEAGNMGTDALDQARAASDAYLQALEANLQNELQINFQNNLPELREELNQFNSEAQAAQQAFAQSVAQSFNSSNQQNPAAQQRQKMIDKLNGIQQILAGQTPVALSPIP